MYSYGQGIDMLDTDKSILVVIKSVPDEKDPSHRIIVNHAGILIKSISKNKCHCCILANCDPKFTYVPYFVINYLMKNAGYYLLSYIRKICSTMALEGDHKERIEKKTEVYDDIRSRIK